MANPPRRVIPREELTAWERWELGTIDDPTPPRIRPVPQPVPAPVPASEAAPAPQAAPEADSAPAMADQPVLPRVPLPTAEELEAIHQQAHQEGFDAGQTEGLAAGRAQAEDEINRLKVLLDQLANYSERAQAELAESVLDLALVVGRELARVEIAADRNRVLPVIRELIDSMPVVRAPARIIAHPDDVDALESLLGVELPRDVWRIVVDPNQEPGGARVETPTLRADLSLTSRWATQLKVLQRANRADLVWNAEVPLAPEPAAPAPAPAPAAAAEPAQRPIVPPDMEKVSLDLDEPADDDEPV
ncbi:flagellar assembly protein FliH [Silvimonas iriomotensis]|uniref:Flagellar assembly protein FliH n=1 Tax=Silvimonas iriomotensis TaxID=449662 RepID=A0ABQ2P8E9_9NEIS|nr:flagellar assembly protein FliH [Silvimonas iriomotensis]GGP20753.1 hypothetical protein GCM10010970_16780 [Silvimonas iriomotensis]